MTGLGSAAVHLVHGLDHEAVAPDWPPLEPGEVDRVLRQYEGVGELRELSWHSPRPFSAAALAETTLDTLFVKRHHRSVRTMAALDEEHGFIGHLRGRGATVPEVLTTANRATSVADGEWTYEIHTRGPGFDLYREALSWSPFASTRHARAAGTALARLHRAAAGYAAPARRTEVLVSSCTLLGTTDLAGAVGRLLGRRRDLARFLARRPWRRDIAQLLEPFHRRLVPHLGGLRPLWTHNDWHASNLLWSDAGDRAEVSAVLDFGLADRTWAVYDLATALERNAIDWLGIPSGCPEPVRFDHVAALLAGYEAAAPLSPSEAEALIALLPIVHLEFALSEIGYF
ncbi:MAG TPA: phosphotransferase, partial [Stellaceae bacterium]|nr:phosphotransferase [Stellaceae bacterium]